MRISDFSRREPGAADVSTANRIAALGARRTATPQLEVPLIAGWVAECLLTEGDEAQIVRVHRQDDHRRRPFVAKILRPRRCRASRSVRPRRAASPPRRPPAQY